MNPTESVFQSVLIRQSEQVFEDIPSAEESRPEQPSAGYILHIATNLQDVERLRPLWNTWTHNLDTDLDYYLDSLKSDSTTLSPYVITVFQDSIAQAMLVGRVRKRKMSAVVSFVRLPGPKVKVLEIARRGRLGRQSPAVDKLLASELFKAIDGGDVDVLCFQRLPLCSELFRQIQQLPGLLIKERVAHIFYYSVLPLTTAEKDRPEIFSGKMRREIRRKTRILDRAFPGRVRMKSFCQASEIDEGLRDALRVAVRTWQSYLGDGLSDTLQIRENFRFLAKKGWLRIYVLYINDEPCAFLVGQLYNNFFYCQYAGYDPNYMRFSVGSLLTARAFDNLAAAGVQRVDLGEGDQEHNRRLGCQMTEEGIVHVYSPTLRGLLLNLFFGTTQIVRFGGRRTRSAFRLDWLDKVWSQFLVSRWRSGHTSLELPVQGPR